MSYKGSREAFITALKEMVLEDSRIMLVSADSKLAARAGDFSKEHANNFAEVGIAE